MMGLHIYVMQLALERQAKLQVDIVSAHQSTEYNPRKRRPLPILYLLGGTFANTCRVAGAGTSATTAAAAASSSDASGTSVIGNNLLASSNTAAGGASTTAKAASVSSGGGSAVSATDSSASRFSNGYRLRPL